MLGMDGDDRKTMRESERNIRRMRESERIGRSERIGMRESERIGRSERIGMRESERFGR